MSRIAFVALFFLSFFSEGLFGQQKEPLFPDFSSKIGISGKTRIVRMTAHLKAVNKSRTPIDRYVYRLTIPPNTQSQKCFLEKSTTAVAAKKDHKNGCSQFVEFHFPIDGNSTHSIDVSFLALLRPVNYLKTKALHEPIKLPEDETLRWLAPSWLIESDSAEVQSASESAFAKSKDDAKSLASAAYQFPKTSLKFKLQKANLGAQEALQTGIGDCTEFACLFAALCRTKSIPARKIAVFNFGKNKKLKKNTPNHHIAEFYLESHGWIPADPTLGKGKFNRPVGFGKLSNTIVLYNREGAWVWQTQLPKDSYDKSMPKPKVDYQISWDGKVIGEGSLKNLTQVFEDAYQKRAKPEGHSNDAD